MTAIGLTAISTKLAHDASLALKARAKDGADGSAAQSVVERVERVEVEKLPDDVAQAMADLATRVHEVENRPPIESTRDVVVRETQADDVQDDPRFDEFDQRITKLENLPTPLTPVVPDDLDQRLADIEELLANQPVADNDTVAVPRAFGDLVSTVGEIVDRLDEHDDAFAGLLESGLAHDSINVREGDEGHYQVNIEDNAPDLASEVSDLAATVMSAFAIAQSESEKARVRINDLDTDNVKLRGTVKQVNDRLDDLINSMNEEAKRA